MVESRHLDWIRRCGPAAAVLVLTVGLWLGFGVGASDIALFLGYEVLFLLVPGWLLYVALSGRRHSLLREVSVGWALGHVVEILAFGLTASLGLRGWFVLYPVLIIGGSLTVIRRRSSAAGERAESGEAPFAWDSYWGWAVAGVLAIALLYIAAIYFAQTPLPGNSGFQGYFFDLTFHLDLSGYLLHHWPLASPEVSGTHLPYELFVYMHLVPVAQVTGIHLPVLLFRLYLVPALALFVIQVSWASRRLTGQPWSGPIAAALVLLVSEIYPLRSDMPASLHPLVYSTISPTFMLGLIMFVPAVMLVAEQAGTIRTVPRDRRWLVLALLLIGCSGAKGTVLPVLIGGLILYLAWRLLRERSIDVEAGKVLALTLGVFAVTYVVLYRGENEGLRLSLQGTAAEIPRIVRLADPFAHIPIISTLFWIIGNAVWVLMLGAAPLAGLVWLFKQRGERAQRSTVLLLGMLIAGLFPYFFLVAPAYNQLWFTEYGYVAAAILSAQGLCLFWRSWRSTARNPRSSIALLAVGSALGGVLLTYLGYSLGFSSSLGYASWAAIVIAIAVAYVASTGRRGQWVTVLALLPIMVYGSLRLPVQIAPELVETGPEPWYANNYGTVPGGLVVGLDWIRNHTSPNSVLAVNNYYLSPQLPQFPGFMFYSALSERQVYLEGWTDTAAVLGRTELSAIAGRRILNDAVFQRADPRSLAQMVSKAGVDYLLVDRVNDTVSPDLSRLATLVYSNNDVAIYAVRGRA